jgi:hypothetical protein
MHAERSGFLPDTKCPITIIAEKVETEGRKKAEEYG